MPAPAFACLRSRTPACACCLALASLDSRAHMVPSLRSLARVVLHLACARSATKSRTEFLQDPRLPMLAYASLRLLPYPCSIEFGRSHGASLISHALIVLFLAPGKPHRLERGARDDCRPSINEKRHRLYSKCRDCRQCSRGGHPRMTRHATQVGGGAMYSRVFIPSGRCLKPFSLPQA